MTGKREDKQLETDLAAMVAPAFPGMTVAVERSSRWNRMCVTFRWPGFAKLLPEERYQRLSTVIPAAFRESRLAGFVWLELAAKETVDQYLRLPRSEDVAEREADIHAALVEAEFFKSLEALMGPNPSAGCGGAFANVETVLSRKKYSAAKIRAAKLVFIRHGAFCDCQVLQTVRSELARRYAEVR